MKRNFEQAADAEIARCAAMIRVARLRGAVQRDLAPLADLADAIRDLDIIEGRAA